MNISLFIKNWVIVLIAIPAVIILLEASIRLYLFLNPEIVRLTELQEQTQKAFEDYAKTVTTAGEEKKLSELTPFEWDYALSVSYYSDGERAAKKLIASGLVPIDLRNYTILDQRMGDTKQGVVFINKKETFLLTIPLDTPFSGGDIAFAKSNEACLQSNFGPWSNKFFIFLECEKRD